MENKRTIVAIVIVTILIIALLLVSYLRYSFDQKEIKKLTDESNKILQQNIAIDEIDMEIKTEKNYAIVEKAIKEYIQKLKDIYIKMNELKDQINPEEIFSAENVEDKNLEEVDKIIDEYKQKSKEYLEEYRNLIKEEKIEENINSKKFTSKEKYYVDLYNSVMLGNAMKSQYENLEIEIENSKDQIYDKINILTNAKHYLENRKNHWSVKDGRIIFKNNNIMIGYYNIINELL